MEADKTKSIRNEMGIKNELDCPIFFVPPQYRKMATALMYKDVATAFFKADFQITFTILL